MKWIVLLFLGIVAVTLIGGGSIRGFPEWSMLGYFLFGFILAQLKQEKT